MSSSNEFKFKKKKKKKEENLLVITFVFIYMLNAVNLGGSYLIEKVKFYVINKSLKFEPYSHELEEN